MGRAIILLVGAADCTRDGLQEVLQHHGFEVVPATSVTQAQNAIASRRFDILIVDLYTRNPEAASKMIAAMRRSQPWAATVSLVNALDPSGPFGQADHVLEKPIAVKELVALLANAIEERQHPGNPTIE